MSKQRGPQWQSRVRGLHRTAIGALFLILIASIGGQLPAFAQTIRVNLTFLNASTEIDGVQFFQFTPTEAAGTGLFDTFLSTQNAGSQQGYNTTGTFQFDEKPPTRALSLAEVPQVVIDDVVYREFQLDVNENVDELLSLNEFQVFTADDPGYTGYDGNVPSIGGATFLVFDMNAGPATYSLDLNYGLNAGSGKADYIVLVPEEKFADDGSCTFDPDFDPATSVCTTWVYVYNQLGVPTGAYETDAGFDEWGVTGGTGPVYRARDWGDLPDSTVGGPYATKFIDDGPRHVIVATLGLGAEIDSELDGQPDLAAAGDDTNGTVPDDEDGVSIPILPEGSEAPFDLTVTIRNTTGDSARLACWIDFDQDGAFDDLTEKAVLDTTANGPVNLTFTPPAPIKSGDQFIRCRIAYVADWAAVGGEAPVGFVASGEVEDNVTAAGPPLAVTIGYVHAARTGEEVQFNWQTVTENGTAGFNVTVESAGARMQLNEALLPSPAVDSATPTLYHFSASTGENHFYLEEVSVNGAIRRHGPYDVGVEYGDYTASDPVTPAAYLPLMRR